MNITATSAKVMHKLKKTVRDHNAITRCVKQGCVNVWGLHYD